MRPIFALLAFILTTCAAAAETFSVEALREAVAAKDFDAVDAGIDAAQEGFLAGEVSAGHMRELFIALSRSAPDMVAFGEEWLAHDPENPKAQIARAWTLHNAARFVEMGDNQYSLYVATMMREERDKLAKSAYQRAPDLIPANDAIVRGLGRVGMDVPHPAEALDIILNEHPNFGSIYRSITSGYLMRSSAEIIRGYCSAVAESFDTDAQESINHRCLMQAAITLNRQEIEEYLEEHLWTDNSPETAINRLAYFIGKYEFAEATEEQIAWAQDTMLTYDVDQFELAYLDWYAKTFESRMLQSHGVVTNLHHEFRKAHLDRAERFLEQDPLNIDLLDLVEGMRFEPDREIVKEANGNVSIRSVKTNETPEESRERRQAGKAQKADFLLRRLQAMPYSSELWRDVSYHISSLNGPDTIFDGDAALQNSVVFSNDPADALRFLMNRKAMHWETVQKAEAMPDEEMAKLPNWQRFLSNLNREEDVLCPFLRARLLQNAICDSYPEEHYSCRHDTEEWAAQLDEIQKIAEQAPACAGLLTAAPEDMWYDAVDFDVALETLD